MSEQFPRGLPQRLPDGERLLWQGAPTTGALLRHTFHIRLMALYFSIILVWCAVVVIGHGGSAQAMRGALMDRVELAAVPFVLVAVYAWAIQRSTVYSITSRRVVISFGLALPVTFNLPFSRIESASLRLYPGGAGDIPLRLLPSEKLSYFVVWPHARPWRTGQTEPMLRCVPDAQAVCAVLAEALAQHETVAAPVQVAATKPVRMPVGFGLRSRAMAAE